MRQWSKVLRIVGTAGVLLFVTQLFLAIGGEWVPEQVLGHVTYPIYLGRHPWTFDCIGLNISILVSSLAAAYLADVLEREAAGKEAAEWRRRQKALERPVFIKPV